MKSNRRYLVTVALLAVLAVAFGMLGTVAPPLTEEASPVQPQQMSSSDSVGHFANPPTYDSGWVDIRSKAGQYFSLKHNLNSTDVVVDIAGKQSLDPMGGALAWSKAYGGTDFDTSYSVVETSDGGYAIAGYSYSYGAVSSDAWLGKTDSTGNLLWNKTYGGASLDIASSMVETSDGGYALAGNTYSYAAGGCDSWLVKTDSAGTMQWNKTYGGASYDYGDSLVQTSDGGYALAGNTYSYGAGSDDFFLVRTDSTGTMLWNKTYGGTGRDCARSVVETSDGGYALAGWTNSYGAGYSFWLVKTDSAGTMQWNKTYGGAGSDVAYSMVQTIDEGYALAGYTDSYGIDTPGHFDMYLVKTYADGTMAWNRTCGGASEDYALSVVQTEDEGYSLAGNTYPYGASIGDAWLVKTDSTGNLQWNKTYGGTGDDCARSVMETADAGYVFAGYTRSYGAGDSDIWLVKVKPKMNLEHRRNLGGTDVNIGWSRAYGGTEDDFAYSLVQTVDGGYALTGYTQSYSSNLDFYLVKTDAVGNMMWSKNYGGASSDVAYSVVETSDGGYAIAGQTNSYGVGGQPDFWLVKTDSAGNKLWNKTYGGASGETAFSLVQTDDHGYALAGGTNSYGAGGADFWLVKTDSYGSALWNETYGGDNLEVALSLVQTVDGGYAMAGYANSSDTSLDFWLVRTDSAGNALWNRTYGGENREIAYSLVQTIDGGFALAGFMNSSSSGYDFYLVKTDAVGNMVWSRTYGGAGDDNGCSVVETSDGGYAIAGFTHGPSGADFWLVRTDSAGVVLWSKTYGGTTGTVALSVVQTRDGGYAMGGSTLSYDTVDADCLLVKTDTECGLTQTGLTANAITVYRGRTDQDWNYVRVRIWLIKEPTWMYGDINMDGIVDSKDLYIIGRNYGKTFSLLSLSGIIAVAGIHTVKKRKQPKQPSYIS